MNRIEPVLGNTSLTAEPSQRVVSPAAHRSSRSKSPAQPSFIAMHGRLSLSWYWLYHAVLNLLLPMPLYATAWYLFGHELRSLLLSAGSILFFHCWLALSLMIRRLHDLNRGGWLSLISLTPLGPVLGVYLLIWPGQRTENRFGKASQTMTASQRYLSLGLLAVAFVAVLTTFWYHGEQIQSAKAALALALQQALWGHP